jgi:hypothetical protein
VDGIRIEGLTELIATLTAAELKAAPGVFDVVGHGAFNIKKDWQRAWTGLKHAPSAARAVSYETRRHAADVSAEIGPDKDKPQGALGNLLEYGSVNNPPHPGGAPALDAEAPRFEKALGDLFAALLDG